ncbi:two-component system response regulator [Sulfurimicrobium lacus]|uniref:Two-component system response regulator n=1 Tax=Sulfurimicrobium lacus TaxID=2715678 RepID=A0A6F8V6N1_9PROT|nr:HD domain-containing phosphohydrolase [Sulfurimicrobium lacus]BCB25314.1 two-component system response regulator [Sulfurimicrobium lacus]
MEAVSRLNNPSATASTFTLLFVDDEPDIVDSLHRSFRKGYKVLTATSGQEAVEYIKTQPVDLIISDQRMPGLTGDEVLKAAKELQPNAIRILLTGYSDLESLVKCVNEAGIYKYLSKPWEPEDLKLTVIRALEHLDLDRRLKLASEHLKDAYMDAVTMLSFACEGKDEDTGFHVQRVQHFTEALARELGLGEEESVHMGVMSILHDIGKLNIPDSILKKPAKLDPDEWAIIRKHTEHGVRILGSNPFYDIAREIAGGHHENWDGSGYPQRLEGEATPLSARLVKVADVFDALTSRRPYKEPWTVEAALDALREQSGKQFDPAIVAAFMRLNEAGTITRILEEYHG